jgi:hypothetical protein
MMKGPSLVRGDYPALLGDDSPYSPHPGRQLGVSGQAPARALWHYHRQGLDTLLRARELKLKLDILYTNVEGEAVTAI